MILLSILLVVAAFSAWSWVTRKFWLPRYVHVLASGALVVGV
jgi:hypothetical protein